MDVGSAARLAQYDLHIIEQISNRIIPPYLFDPSIPDQARVTRGLACSPRIKLGAPPAAPMLS
eukprot:887027-Pelagomonas_calceolata.AAC.1